MPKLQARFALSLTMKPCWLPASTRAGRNRTAVRPFPSTCQGSCGTGRAALIQNAWHHTWGDRHLCTMGHPKAKAQAGPYRSRQNQARLAPSATMQERARALTHLTLNQAGVNSNAAESTVLATCFISARTFGVSNNDGVQ